jgi:hypothetical protein
MSYPHQVEYLESLSLRAPLMQAQAEVLVDYIGASGRCSIVRLLRCGCKMQRLSRRPNEKGPASLRGLIRNA